MSSAHVRGEVFVGRGAGKNPPNRFERIEYVPDEEARDGDASLAPSVPTQLFRDASRTIVTYNDSPDVGFSASVNPYRGCEHGCVYCYARPTHEYFGLSAGLDFETKLFAKESAPELLREELSARRWVPQPVVMSGVTDAYQPVERRLQIARGCLAVFRDFRNPVGIVTKSDLVTRDLDLLGELASFACAAAFVSVTTLDADLGRRLEPRAPTPERRLAAVEALARAGVPTGVMVSPVLPGLTDHEIPAILGEAARRGARFASFTLLRLPFAVAPLFEDWLERQAPLRRRKVTALIRETRAGRLNDARFGSRMKGDGPYAAQIARLFEVAARRAGIGGRRPELSTAGFRLPPGPQLALFG